MFEPIAIVGRGAVFPGAPSLDAFSSAIRNKQDLLTEVPKGAWPVDTKETAAEFKHIKQYENRPPFRGGFVIDDDVAFDPADHGLSIDEASVLDRSTKWLLSAGRAAFKEAGFPGFSPERAATIVGNLSYPTQAATEMALQAVLGNGADPAFKHLALERFSSGRPAALLAKSLGAKGHAFCLDAACASALYATKYACDLLIENAADIAFVGGVNGLYNIGLHGGFAHIHALSPSGLSRPFHADADGLIPSEGAGAMVLKRLCDAVRDGDVIHGVIRGIGLSNDGRDKGVLAPSQAGQTAALKKAYETAGIEPETIGFVECHATGTSTGDAVELETLKSFYHALPSLPIGSVKSNIGHLITAAGLAGIFKVIGSFETGILPPTIHVDALNSAAQHSNLRVATQDEPWPEGRVKRAGLNNFGFGGNNAHLILEEYTPDKVSYPSAVPPTSQSGTLGDQEIVICAIEWAAGDLRNDDVLAIKDDDRRANEINIPIKGSAFPPIEIANSLGQQSLPLELASRLLSRVKRPPSDRIGLVIGMGMDLEGDRDCLRWRLRNQTGMFKRELSHCEIAEALKPLVGSHACLGAMPNLVANRVSVQHDIQGYGITISSEELSGLTAIELGCRALRNREADLFIAGAVDLSAEEIHQIACQAIPGLKNRKHLDGGCLFALKRRSDAIRDGDRILAEIDFDAFCEAPDMAAEPDRGQPTFGERHGYAHAAAGVMDLAHVIFSHYATEKHDEHPARFGQYPVPQSLSARSFVGWKQSWTVTPYPTSNPANQRISEELITWFGASDTRDGLRAALEDDTPSLTGSHRLAIIANSPSDMEAKKAAVKRRLTEGAVPNVPGIAFSSEPVSGELAFIYPGMGSAYPEGSLGWIETFPDVLGVFRERMSADAWVSIHDAVLNSADPEDPFAQVLTGSAIAFFNSDMARLVFGLRPDAVLGVSQGEANMLVATGVWQNGYEILVGLHYQDRFYEGIGGKRTALNAYYGKPEGTVVDWDCYEAIGPVDVVNDAVKDIDDVWNMITYAPNHCYLGGLPDACEKLFEKVGKSVRFVRNPVGPAFHGPFANSFKEAFWHRHHVPTFTPDRTRIYFNSIHGYTEQLDPKTCADLYTQSGFEKIDFTKTVEAAWNDGVRIFVDVGPRTGLSKAVSRILEGKPHWTVPLDLAGQTAVYKFANAAAHLFVLDLLPDLEGVRARLALHSRSADDTPIRTFSVPAHRENMELSIIRNCVDHPARPDSQMTTKRSPGTGLNNAPENTSSTPAGTRPGTEKAPGIQSPAAPDATAGLEQKTGTLIALTQEKRAAMQRMRAAPKLRASFGFSTRDKGSPPISNVVPMPIRSPAKPIEMNMVREIMKAGSTAYSHASNLATAEAAPDSIMEFPKHTEAHTLSPIDFQSNEQKPQEANMNTAAKPSIFTASKQKFVPLEKVEPSGLTLSREELEHVAGDKISKVFGPLFEQQDGFHRQCRMPQPPLLLVDRVTGIAGEPGSMEKGICWTETDVHPDAWYLDGKKMPTGILIESGQADLLLISWLGCDFLNRDERIYRLLGCEVVFHNRPMPVVGDTIKYQIHIDGHANFGDTRMFFFRYDARINDELLISVRSGQAGFFSDAELAGSDGVLWDAADETIDETLPFELPETVCKKTRFSSQEIAAFSEGKPYECFGEGFELTAAHTKPPSIPSGRMQMFEEIEEFDPHGGPWGRGYLRAKSIVAPDSWFYEGHFFNDPCMPGTLMAEAAAQAMVFHMAAVGLTIDKDGFQFRPATDTPFKFVCRGQVIPDATHEVTYEVFVEEIKYENGIPVMYAALLAKSDGFKVFLCRRFGVTLERDWPINDQNDVDVSNIEPRIVSPNGNVRGDYFALLSAAWGKPSDAYGPGALETDPNLDKGAYPPRLPGPPYHCMSRVLSVDCDPGVETVGGLVKSEFDVEPDAWYFEDGATGNMPFSILSEVLLQPCGWLATYMGYAHGKNLKFRNLDASDVVAHAPVTPDTGTLSLETRFVKSSIAGPMVLVFYEVKCWANDKLIMELKTDFGFFPAEALIKQKGLPVKPEQREAISEKGLAIPDQEGTNALHDSTAPSLPSGRLAMVDSVTGYEPEGGNHALGRLIGRQSIDPNGWYFKAHFFTDPVQPGSLGLEALFTLFKSLVRKKGLHQRFQNPVFEAPAMGEAFEWHYRGQVIPTNKQVVTEFELSEIVDEGPSVLVKGNGSLWVDGLRIYEVKNYALRIVEGPSSTPLSVARPTGGAIQNAQITIDLAKEPWLHGHKPSFVTPVYPMMGIAGKLMSTSHGVPGLTPARAIQNLEIRDWLRLDQGPVILGVTAQPNGDRTAVSMGRVNADGGLEKTIIQATLENGPYRQAPQKWAPIADGKTVANPYSGGGLFHDGPFEVAYNMVMGQGASSFVFDIGETLDRANGDPTILWDAIVHGNQYYSPKDWFGEAAANNISMPYRLDRFEIFEPLPTNGTGEVVSRAVKIPNQRMVQFDFQLSVDGRVAAEGLLSAALIPFDPYVGVPMSVLRRFFLSTVPDPRVRISRIEGAQTRLRLADVKYANYVSGTVEKAYGVDPLLPNGSIDTLCQIAIKDHVRRTLNIHPSLITVSADSVTPANHAPIPRSVFSMTITDDEVTVT